MVVNNMHFTVNGFQQYALKHNTHLRTFCRLHKNDHYFILLVQQGRVGMGKTKQICANGIIKILKVKMSDLKGFVQTGFFK